MSDNACTEPEGPRHLYKYKSLQGQGRGHLEQLFRRAEIYLAPPESFNDPFDCRVHMEFSKSPHTYRKKLVSDLKKVRPEFNRKQREQLAADIVRSNPSGQRAYLEELQGHVARELGVFCLCEQRDDILMWSHYGAGHSGVCLEFEVNLRLEASVSSPSTNSSHRMPSPMRVLYASGFPAVKFQDSDERQVRALFLTKAEQWSYEREWRLIDWRGPGIKKFDPRSLSGVIFGCRMPEKDRITLKEWIAAGPTQPRFYEGVVAERSYSLHVQSL
jgi:hypothetical protein